MRAAPGGELTPRGSIQRVIARLDAISGTLPTTDGVRAFNQMYLVTTEQVFAAMDGLSFADPTFMARLDVVFAELYLSALSDHAADPGRAPRCWRVLFEARARSGIHPLQFAVAGMNAHINHDLALALVQTAAELGGRLDDGGPWRADFLAINEVLARTQPVVKAELLSGALTGLDLALGDADERVGMWGIETAREFAWSTAQALWAVRGGPVEPSFRRAMDKAVALSSTLLLRPL